MGTRARILPAAPRAAPAPPPPPTAATDEVRGRSPRRRQDRRPRALPAAPIGQPAQPCRPAQLTPGGGQRRRGKRRRVGASLPDPAWPFEAGIVGAQELPMRVFVED